MIFHPPSPLQPLPVEMAAAAKDDKYENQVASSVIEAERVLTEKGLSPKDAREISTFRVFEEPTVCMEPVFRKW